MASKLFVRRALVAGAAAIVLAGGRPAWAQAPPVSDQCITQLTNCYYWAAMQYGFWNTWAAGLDCEIQAAECLRLAVLGH